MSKKIFYDVAANENLNAVVLDIPDWEGFDKLIQFVKKYVSVLPNTSFH